MVNPAFDTGSRRTFVWTRYRRRQRANCGCNGHPRNVERFQHEHEGEIQIIMGTAEESDWDEMAAMQRPRRNQASHFIDASYPVVIAESGFVSWTLGIEKTSLARISSRASILELKGGNFLTQVPGEAWMILKPGRNESYEALKKRIQSVSNGVVSQFGAPFSATVSSTTTGILPPLSGRQCIPQRQRTEPMPSDCGDCNELTSIGMKNH